MANEQPPEEFVEQRINNDHSGIFYASRSGEFFERPALLDDCNDVCADFDPLSFNGLCTAINWEILVFSDPNPIESLFNEGSPPKRDHDLIQKLLELLSTSNTSTDSDRLLALAVQLGMAYQRLLLRPAEEMARAQIETRKQRKSLSKNRQKITPDKACELCEQIQEENEKLNTRSVARKAAAQYHKECGSNVTPETIRRIWIKHREDWRKVRAREKRASELRLTLLAELEAKHQQPPGLNCSTGEDDIPW